MEGRVRLTLLLVTLLAATLWLSSVAAAGDSQRVAYAFTVVGPRSVSQSQLVARAIIERPEARCPAVLARRRDGTRIRIRMARIPVPNGSVGFDEVTACLVSLPRGLATASVAGHPLPLLPPGTPSRIVAFGDTGCRIASFPPTPPATEPGYEIQHCNSPVAWPLETIAEEIAAAKPDLILDTGDYFYREADCPTTGPETPKCAGSPPVNPSGSPNEDTWAGWRADWFRPARALFPVAPLVLARGNHESCERAGTGYFYLLDPGVSPADTCQRVYAAVYDPAAPPPSIAERTWVARFGSIDLVVLDSTNANDMAIENMDVYAALGRRAVRLLRPGSTGWLLTHRPVYGWERFAGPDSPAIWTNPTLQAALDSVIRPFAAVFSGHLHLFQTVEIPGRPAQLTLGDGGTLLDASDQGGALPSFGPLTNEPGYQPVPAPTDGVTTFTFGWMLLRPAARSNVFSGTRYEAGKGPWARCRLAHHDIACRLLR